MATIALWLSKRGLDVRCIGLKPSSLDGQVIVDVQQLIPLPEAAEHQVRVREKQERERAATMSKWDLDKFLMDIDRNCGAYARSISMIRPGDASLAANERLVAIPSTAPFGHGVFDVLHIEIYIHVNSVMPSAGFLVWIGRTMPEYHAKACKGADHHHCIGKEEDRVFDEPTIDQKAGRGCHLPNE
jgi:hypothetical protein